MRLVDDDGTETEIFEPRVRKIMRYLTARQEKTAAIRHGIVSLQFGDPHQEFEARWTTIERRR